MLFERIAGKSKKKSEGQQTIPYLQTIIINAYFCIEFGSPSKIKPLLFWVLYNIVLKTEDILVLVYLVVLAVLGFFLYIFTLEKGEKEFSFVSASFSQNPEQKLFGNGLSTEYRAIKG